MAKKKNDYLDGLVAELYKMNDDASILTGNALSVVNEWIDTGSMALNAICSGSLYKGVPQGRITGLGGPSGCGKTVMLNKIIGNFQAADPERIALVWDSENALDDRTSRSVGADPDRTIHLPVETVNDCRNQIVTFLNTIMKDKSKHGKFIIGIDSLGNLASSKEIADAEKGSSAVDMGLRAKELKSMLRCLTYKVAKTRTTLVFTNHIYADPSAMYESILKNQAGGSGPTYMASLLVQLGVKPEKHDDKNADDVMLAGAKKYSGAALRAMTAKNRFIPQYLATELYINFATGLDKYGGLKEMAVQFGDLIQTGTTYQLPDGEKIGYYKNFRHDDEVWDKILPGLESSLQREWQFSDSSLEEIEQAVEELQEVEA